MIDPDQERYDPLEPSSLAGATRFIACTPKRLPDEWAIEAARRAVEENPANAPQMENLWSVFRMASTPQRIAALTNAYWGPAPRVFSVYFMEHTSNALANRIIGVGNEWAKFGNKSYAHSSSPTSDVRISRGRGGLYSYVGTDNAAIPFNQQTMNLEGYSESTPLSELMRGGGHEFGHHRGYIHEHQRQEIIDLLIAEAIYRKYKIEQGWSRPEIRRQVLTSVEEVRLMQVPGHSYVDKTSIMGYQFDASLTKNGQPILGGSVINANDAAYDAYIYPKTVGPIDPLPSSTRMCRVEDPRTGDTWSGLLQLQKMEAE